MSQFKDIDILAINETKLDATIKDGEVHLPGYDVVRKDRESNGRNGGGVCIYVRSNINFQLRADLSPNNLECLTVEITKPRSKPFLLSTWYRPPQSSPDLFSTFERIIDKIDAENLELYLMGDLNCNLLSEVVSNNSSHLLNIIDIYGLTQLITEPTRVTQYSSTLIDLCLTNSPDKISKSGVINIGISDHSAIYLTPKVAHRLDIAEAFNNFTNVGQSVAQEIPSSEIDPLAYVNTVDRVFSFQRINVQKVIKLLKAIDVSKATGLDKIPNSLQKIAADVVAPSLTASLINR